MREVGSEREEARERKMFCIEEAVSPPGVRLPRGSRTPFAIYYYHQPLLLDHLLTIRSRSKQQ